MQSVSRLAHDDPADATRKSDETNMLPFLVGLLLEIAIGAVPFHLGEGIKLRLGNADGAFLASLLVGHFRRAGSPQLHVPQAARNITREPGLMLYLAGAGVNTGSHFVEVLQAQMITFFLAGQW